ncbi:hypothetical protein SHKM778_45440 [Streptomyces sp. KM77-8]|uniref:Uncharacterized protein n=1 Tax=Streptomyces haneummycinicus TaxID=3074435 RepID=A0AAT9HLF1_9ACTN
MGYRASGADSGRGGADEGVRRPAPPDKPSGAVTPDAGETLPPGWRIAGEDGRNHLEWRAPEPVPMGDSRVEFRANGALVGVPEPQDDGRTFRIPSTRSAPQTWTTSRSRRPGAGSMKPRARARAAR